jgi:phage tail-like protein
MANAANETVRYPFTAFNFAVEINVPGMSTKVCSAAFSECDGLEQTMDVKTIREGGSNARQIRLAGAVSYSQLTLKRGMTAGFDLWNWFAAVQQDPALRASGEVVLRAPDHSDRVRFQLRRCLPLKLKAPPLNATGGGVAVEELQVAYESLTLVPVGGGPHA